MDASEVLLASPFELNKAFRSSSDVDIPRIVHDISSAISVQSKLASSLVTIGPEDAEQGVDDKAPEGWIGSGDEQIDRLLGGGIRRGLLTEVAGERYVDSAHDSPHAPSSLNDHIPRPPSASGKSHFGLQLALTAQLPSCSAEPGGAILLTSERKISFTRLEQIAQSRLAGEAPVKVTATKRFLDNVHTMHVTEVDGLEHALAYMVPNVIESSAALSTSTTTPRPHQKLAQLPISLIVIDSIGALFRASYDSNQGGLSQRSRMLCVLADRLKYLAHKYNIAVVVINQVSDVFGSAPLLDGPSRFSRPNSPALDNGRGSPILDNVQPTMTYKVQSQYFSGQTKSLAKEASLGLVWANAVNVRIMLSRTGRRRPLDAQDLTRRIKRPRTVDGRYRQDLQQEEQSRRKEVLAHDPSAIEESAEPHWEATLIRRMSLVFSPLSKQDSIDYVILQSGIHSLPPADYNADTDNAPVATSVMPGYQSRSEPQAFDDDLHNEIFDDLGNLPVDFWTSEAFDQMHEDLKDGPPR